MKSLSNSRNCSDNFSNIFGRIAARISWKDPSFGPKKLRFLGPEQCNFPLNREIVPEILGNYFQESFKLRKNLAGNVHEKVRFLAS
jgi:hypothetical protein